MMEGIWWWGWVIGSEWRTYGEKVQVALLDWSFCKDQDLEEAEELVRGQSEGRVDQEERIDCVQAWGMSMCLCESQVATVGRWEESSSTAFPGHKQGWEVEPLAPIWDPLHARRGFNLCTITLGPFTEFVTHRIGQSQRALSTCVATSMIPLLFSFAAFLAECSLKTPKIAVLF